MSLSKYKVISQCIASIKFNDHYIINVLLKINAKVLVTDDECLQYVCISFFGYHFCFSMPSIPCSLVG